jgi:hypothetical protein
MGAKALVLTLDVTAAGTGSITVTINRKDWASGKYTTLLAGLPVTANGTNVYKVSPLLPAAANSIAQDLIGQAIQIVVTANNANPMTYSVGYDLIRG